MEFTLKWFRPPNAMSSRNLTYIKEDVCLYVNKNGETRAIQVHVWLWWNLISISLLVYTNINIGRYIPAISLCVPILCWQRFKLLRRGILNDSLATSNRTTNWVHANLHWTFLLSDKESPTIDFWKWTWNTNWTIIWQWHPTNFF